MLDDWDDPNSWLIEGLWRHRDQTTARGYGWIFGLRERTIIVVYPEPAKHQGEPPQNPRSVAKIRKTIMREADKGTGFYERAAAVLVWFDLNGGPRKIRQ